ncbi:hypothetical protein SAMN05444392_102254 [Seinonella peptonophila]|uniref:Uncharacterized protein n=1 Tax=Seinonella peptonophila TaxID=112248 RepID=A0A1M4VA39_9BACL|nr:hypothetical protein [Seinonella peptonophila]SHE65743.1 hypothetical protein SAMN05444392_102254 [Seinonella peptonophila]
MHELISPTIINPFWHNALAGGTHEGKVLDSETVELHGVVLKVATWEKVTLVPGDLVYIHVGGDLTFMTKEEKEKRDEEKRISAERLARIRKRWREIEEKKESEHKQRAKEFNESLNIPVNWRPDIKMVMSGLSENSMGNGMNRRSVYHVLLLDDLKDGRLKRSSPSFLCTSKNGSNGNKNWNIYEEDYDRWTMEHKVTCKQCIKIAKRWEKDEYRNLS